TRQVLGLRGRAGAPQFAGTLANPLASSPTDPAGRAGREERSEHVGREAGVRNALLDDGARSVS
ncbi:IucA/IucC family siderophore biosynthesis protein, partial [Mycobacterium tuberculosis]|nr:IucA/IucC family siderophore biosynthesis protein [Mycobacterium tuberculosis]